MAFNNFMDIFEHPHVVQGGDVFDRMQPSPEGTKLLVCRPDYISTKIPNNVYMEGKNKEPVDVPRALNHWDRIMHILEAFGVKLFQIPPKKGAQDQTFTANIGITIAPYFILSNFKAAGRPIEVDPAKKYLTELGYDCIQPPFKFEGIADIKKWKPGHYIGGVGLFSTKEAFDWIAEKTGVNILQIKMIDPHIYHADCVILPVNEENFLVTRKGIAPESIKELEKIGNLIFTPEGIETTGITNGILLPEKRIYISGCFQPEQPDYRKACEWLMETMDRFGYTTVFVDTDSFEPSGADCSCLVNTLDFVPTKAQTT